MSKLQCKRTIDNSIMSENKLAYIILLTKFPRRMMETEKAYFFNGLVERGKWNLWTVRVHKDLTYIGISLRFRRLKIARRLCLLKWQWVARDSGDTNWNTFIWICNLGIRTNEGGWMKEAKDDDVIGQVHAPRAPLT